VSANIELVDTTMRDGNQCLWGAIGLTTGMMLEIAPAVDRVGFRAVDFMASTHMAMAVRFHKENPWERIRLIAQAMPATPLSFLTTGMRFISWETAHDDLMQLAFGLIADAGIRRFYVMDPANDVANVLHTSALVKRAGDGEVIAALVFTESPIHDDAHYEARARALAASPLIDRLYVKDPGGLLSPQRAQALIPKVLAAIAGRKPFELHSHCTLGFAPYSYVEAVKAGVGVIHTAVRPAANGTSQPSAEQTISNLRSLGHNVDVDEAALAQMSAYFNELVRAEGLPEGAPLEYDAAFLRHQVPGGMVSTLKRQLTEIGKADLMPAVLEEIAIVRGELGYPIMVTPFSQIVGAQAVMNLLGQRYANVPDEVIRFVIGRFGRPTGAVEPNLLDRIMSLPRTKELLAEPPMAEMSELRRIIGKDLSDEEFLLRAVMPAAQVDAMMQAGPAKRGYSPTLSNVRAMLKDLSARPDIKRFRVERPGFLLELNA
jgi:oxaloacetate decarboxylase (Na+ extruding) subunit alpha